jgi:hypothetical protein
MVVLVRRRRRWKDLSFVAAAVGSFIRRVVHVGYCRMHLLGLTLPTLARPVPVLWVYIVHTFPSSLFDSVVSGIEESFFPIYSMNAAPTGLFGLEIQSSGLRLRHTLSRSDPAVIPMHTLSSISVDSSGVNTVRIS